MSADMLHTFWFGWPAGRRQTSCSSDRALVSFIPSHASLSVNPLSARVSFRLQGDFLSLKRLENCCRALSSGKRRAFVLVACAAESEINCTFIAQPDERLGEMFRCDK